MKNIVNDRDLSEAIPLIERKLILLEYINECLPELKDKLLDNYKKIIDNAKENGYSDEMIIETRKPAFILKGDDKLMKNKIMKLLNIGDGTTM